MKDHRTMDTEEKWGKDGWKPMQWWILGFEDYVYWMNLGLTVIFTQDSDGPHGIRKKR